MRNSPELPNAPVSMKQRLPTNCQPIPMSFDNDHRYPRTRWFRVMRYLFRLWWVLAGVWGAAVLTAVPSLAFGTDPITFAHLQRAWAVSLLGELSFRYPLAFGFAVALSIMLVGLGYWAHIDKVREQRVLAERHRWKERVELEQVFSDEAPRIAEQAAIKVGFDQARTFRKPLQDSVRSTAKRELKRQGDRLFAQLQALIPLLHPSQSTDTSQSADTSNTGRTEPAITAAPVSGIENPSLESAKSNADRGDEMSPGVAIPETSDVTDSMSDLATITSEQTGAASNVDHSVGVHPSQVEELTQAAMGSAEPQHVAKASDSNAQSETGAAQPVCTENGSGSREIVEKQIDGSVPHSVHPEVPGEIPDNGQIDMTPKTEADQAEANQPASSLTADVSPRDGNSPKDDNPVDRLQTDSNSDSSGQLAFNGQLPEAEGGNAQADTSDADMTDTTPVDEMSYPAPIGGETGGAWIVAPASVDETPKDDMPGQETVLQESALTEDNLALSGRADRMHDTRHAHDEWRKEDHSTYGDMIDATTPEWAISAILRMYPAATVGHALRDRRRWLGLAPADISYDSGWVDALERGDWAPAGNASRSFVLYLVRYLEAVRWTVNDLEASISASRQIADIPERYT